MRKLNITNTILDKLGFSEYWDEHGTWGGRTLTFSNGTKFRIIEREEMDDEHEGYASLSGSEATYIANHYYFAGFFAIPKIDAGHYDLFFLHEMYECIEKEYPDCLKEFTNKCKDLNMKPYIDEYLSEREQSPDMGQVDTIVSLPDGVTDIRLRQWEQQENPFNGNEQKLKWLCELSDTCILEGDWNKKITGYGDTQKEAFENAINGWQQVN